MDEKYSNLFQLLRTMFSMAFQNDVKGDKRYYLL